MSVIYALSSGAGRSGVAVIRLSGAGAKGVLSRMIGSLPPPRRASLRRFRGADGDLIDRGLALWFPGPQSYTGEDSAELHVHGSRAVVAAMFRTLSSLGCRPAEAGEFSRRAFLNGRADLIELEALGDLLEADTEAQRRSALHHGDGGLRARVEGWSERLSALLAEAEADLDFSDEDDVLVDLSVGRAAAFALGQEMRDALKGAARSERMRDGFRVAIVGPPNAGKSSLLNALVGHEAAIVSDIPGTTRDLVEVRMDLGGLPVRIVDTAGLRETHDPVEMLGVARARAEAQRADLTLWLAIDRGPNHPRSGVLRVASQRDRFAHVPLPDWADLGVSVLDPGAISALLAVLQERASGGLGQDAALIVNERQTRLIESAAERLVAAGSAVDAEVFAEALRQARLALARVTGRHGAEDVLDLVFGRFCIGK